MALWSNFWRCMSVALLLGGLSWDGALREAARGEDAPAGTPLAELKRDEPVRFADEVLPFLRRNCLACHNQTRPEGELVLESPESIRKGAASGAVVVAGNSAESRLLAVARGAAEPPMPPPNNRVGAVALDGGELALLARWIDEGATGPPRPAGEIEWQAFPADIRPIHAVAISPDGQFAACSRGNRVAVYQVGTGQLLTELDDPRLSQPRAGGAALYSAPGVSHLDFVQSLAFSPDGQWLASGAFREIKLWQRQAPREVVRYPVANIRAMAVSPDTQRAAVVDAMGGVRLLALADGSLGQPLAGWPTAALPQQTAVDLQFSPDGARVVAAAGRSLGLWNVADGALLGRIDLPVEATAVTFSPDGSRIVTGGADGLVRTWLTPVAPPQSLATASDGWTALATSPDRQQIAGADAQGTIHLLDAGTGRLRARLVGHAAPVRQLAFSADGSQLVSAGDDHQLRAWNTATGETVSRIDAGDGALTALALAPAGGLAAVGTEDGQTLQYRLTAPQRWSHTADDRTAGLDAAPTLLAASPSGKLLASDGRAGGLPAVFLRDAAQGTVLRLIPAGEAPLLALAFSADEARLAAVSADGMLRVWNVNDGSPGAAPVAIEGTPSCVQFVGSGQLVTGNTAGGVQLWGLGDATAAPALQRAFASLGHAITGLAASLDATVVGILSAEGLMRFEHLTENKSLASLELGPSATHLAVSPRGDELSVACAAGLVRLSWSGRSLGTLARPTGSAPANLCRGLCYLAGGDQLACIRGGQELQIWSAAGERLVERRTSGADLLALAALGTDALAISTARRELTALPLQFHRAQPALAGRIVGLAWGADGQSLACLDDRGTLRVDSSADGQPRATADHGAAALCLAQSGDGKVLVTAGVDRKLRVWNATTLEATFMAGALLPDGVQSLVLSADGLRAAASLNNGEVALVDLSSGQITQSFLGHEQRVAALAWGAGDTALVTASADRRLIRWPLAAELRLAGHTQAITDLAFLGSAAHLLVSASRDGSVRLWDMASGQMTRQLDLAAPVTALTVRPDGTRLVAVGENGIGRIWNAEDGAQLGEFRGQVPATRRASRWAQIAAAREAKLAAAREALTAADTELTGKAEALAQATSARDGAVTAHQQAEGAVEPLRQAKAAAEAANAQAAAALESAKQQQARATEQVAARQAALEAAQATLAVAKGTQDSLALAHQQVTALAAAAQAALGQQPGDAGLAQAHASAQQAVEQLNTALSAAAGTSTSLEQMLAVRQADLPAAQAELASADAALAQATTAAQQAAETLTAADKPLTDGVAAVAAVLDKRNVAEAALKSAEGARQIAEQQQSVAKSTVEELAEAAAQATAESTAAQQAVEATASRWLGLAYGSQGAQFAAAGRGVQTFDGVSGAAQELLLGESDLGTALAYIGADRLLTTVDGSLRMWDLAPRWMLAATLGPPAGDTWQLAQSLLADRVLALTFSPDSLLLASGGGEPSRSGELKLWNLATRQVQLDLPEAHSDTVCGLDFSLDGRYLATASSDKFVKVFELASGRVARSLEGHTHHVLGVRWRSDGNLLASCGADKVVKVWSFDTGEQQRTIDGFGKEVTGIAFVGATSQSVTSAGDATVRQFNLDDGANTRNFPADPGDFLQTVAATADGRLVISGGQEGVLRIWNAADGAVVASLPPPAPAPAASSAGASAPSGTAGQ